MRRTATDPSMRTSAVFALVLAVVVGSIAAYSLGLPGMGTPNSTPNSTPSSVTTATGCSQPRGVVSAQLSAPSQFGSVTTYSLPSPLKAPNSIAAAPDGSVWFGEVGLRGVAHLFQNGTLREYAWPSDTVGSTTNCLNILELWGIALWHGMVWTSDASNNQLLGLFPANDTFLAVHTGSGTLPRFLAVGGGGRLWFTEASTNTQLGLLDSPTSSPRFFHVPAPAGEMTASVTMYNSTLAYVVTVNSESNNGQVFSFDPSAAEPVFNPVGSSQSLLGPYSAAVADGGLWVSEHEASDVAFFNGSSSSWSFYPTSVLPEVALTLPYYLVGNGSDLWFNEQTGNRVAVLSGDTLTEYNISSKSLTSSGIRNALTIALSGNLVWFTEWTGNAVGFVNASVAAPFSIATEGPDALTLAPGSTGAVTLDVTGRSSALTLQYADSETHLSLPVNLTVASNVSSIYDLSGTKALRLSISAAAATPAGTYLVLATVTDGMTYRSVYVRVDVS